MAINNLQDAAKAIQQLESEVNRNFDAFDARIANLQNRQVVVIIPNGEKRAYFKGFDPSVNVLPPLTIGSGSGDGAAYNDEWIKLELKKLQDGSEWELDQELV